jgi:peptidoglycan/xylan/chitin deacetylase (PgdA/CDA1 family)
MPTDYNFESGLSLADLELYRRLTADIASGGGGDGGGAVASVNGQTGAIVLDAADIGAQPAGDYATAAALTTGLAAKASTTDLAAKAPYRSVPFTPPTQPVTVISAMDSGWSHLNNGAAVHDTTVKASGAASLKITGPAGVDKTTAQLTLTAQNWSDQGLTLRFRTDNMAGIADAYLLVSTSGNFSQFFRIQLLPNMQRVVNNEWTEVTLTRGDFDFDTGSANWATVNGLMIQLYAGGTPNLWIDQIARYTVPARPTISFAFDDGFATVLTAAKPAMDKYGYRGSVYLMPSYVGASGYLTQAQVDGMAEAGWEFGGHGWDDLTTLSAAAAEADVAATKAYLTDRGYRGSDVYVYPLGGQSEALRAMVAKYFGAARGTSTFGQTRSYVNRRNMMTRQLGMNISLATMQGYVDKAIAGNNWLIITGHAFPGTMVNAEDWTPANFAALVDYIASKGVQVLPVAEALASNDAPAEGMYLTAPNGARYRVTVGNDGALTTTAV